MDEGSVLFGFELMHLLDMNCETTSRVEPSRTHAALKMLRFLMLHQDLIGLVRLVNMLA